MFTGDFYNGKLSCRCAAKFARHFLPGVEKQGGQFLPGAASRIFFPGDAPGRPSIIKEICETLQRAAKERNR
jgi:hypothetical protein